MWLFVQIITVMVYQIVCVNACDSGCFGKNFLVFWVDRLPRIMNTIWDASHTIS
jgi:hypothetical protein